MRYVVDLHSHSGYAGGVGDISLESVAETMAKKGIHVFGVGDCLQPAWRETLGKTLVEKERGLYKLRDGEGACASARFIMQTEIIFTSPVKSGGRKGTHVILLFPDYEAAGAACSLMRKWEAKIDIGRPFIKCNDSADVAEKCTRLRAIDEGVMIIPAHVMTPQGVYGSDHPVDSLSEVFGEFTHHIKAVETGLSSDPEMLATLPELDNITLVSNSDCHSGALNRVGREFTVLEIATPSYQEIIAAVHDRRIRYTAEFNPAEGRYFLTGHKAGLERHGQAYCYYSPALTPADGLCPICGKPLTFGVLDRLLYLSKTQSRDGIPRKLGEVKARQEAKTLIPLVEVLAAGLGVKSVSSRKVTALFDSVVRTVGTEAELWELDAKELAHAFASILPNHVLQSILMVKAGDFSFQPGYDGIYGTLALGKKINWYDQENVHRPQYP